MKFSKINQCFYPEDIQYLNIPEDLVSVSDDDFHKSMSRNPGETMDVIDGKLVIIPADALDKKQEWSAYKEQARLLLNESDITIIRCAEFGVAVPKDWIDFRKALRFIISSEDGDYTNPIPKAPNNYPSGT